MWHVHNQMFFAQNITRSIQGRLGVFIVRGHMRVVTERLVSVSCKKPSGQTHESDQVLDGSTCQRYQITQQSNNKPGELGRGH